MDDKECAAADRFFLHGRVYRIVENIFDDGKFDVNTLERRSKTPLHLAAGSSHNATLQILLQNAANSRLNPMDTGQRFTTRVGAQ